MEEEAGALDRPASLAEVEKLPWLLARWRALQSGATAAAANPTLSQFLPGSSTSTSPKTKTSSEQDREWAMQVLELLEWFFIADGPHVCLAFLDHQTPVRPAAGDCGAGQGDADAEKAAIFGALEEVLMSALSSVSREVIGAGSVLHHASVGPLLWDRVRQVCRVDDELVASRLFRCMAFVFGERPPWVSATQNFELAQVALVQMREHSNPNLIVAFIDELPLDKLLIATDQLENVEQLVKLIDRDSRSVVKEALFRCLTRLELRNRRYVDVFLERKMAWAADTGVSSSLRCSALSGLPGRHHSQEKTKCIVEVALSAAAEEENEEPDVAISALQLLAKAFQLTEAYMPTPDLDRYVTMFVRNAVRREPNVPGLLDLAAECAARRCHGAPYSLERLPVELQVLVTAKRKAMQSKDKVKLQKALKVCMLAVGGVLHSRLLNGILPECIAMLQPGNRWQEREGGLLVLGCALQSCYYYDHPGVGDQLLPLILTALSDPQAKVRKMCAWAASRLLRCLDVEQQSALAVHLVRGLDDFPVRHTAWKALTHSGQEPVAQVILRECVAHYVPLERQEEGVDGGGGDDESVQINPYVLRTMAHWLRVLGEHRVRATSEVRRCAQVLFKRLPQTLAKDRKPAYGGLMLRAISAVCQSLEWMIELGPAKVVQTFEQQYTELVALVRSQKKSDNETRLQLQACLDVFASVLRHDQLHVLSQEHAPQWVRYCFAYCAGGMHTDSGLSVLYWLTMRFPERVAPLLPDIIPAALALSRSERRDRDLAMCLHAMASRLGAEMRPWVARLSSALAHEASAFPNDLALRCCVQMVPYGLGDIDDRALFLLAHTSADTLRPWTDPCFKAEPPHRFEVPIESLTDLIVELVVRRSLECSPRDAVPVFTVLIDRLQRSTLAVKGSEDAAASTDPAVREKVSAALHALAAKMGDKVVADKQFRWRPFREGLQRYLPADSALLASLLG